MAERLLPAIGETLAGKYVIESVVGRGGMGAVFAARHTLTDRRVALKWMVPDLGADTLATERFLREARAMGRIDHPRVVGVLDVGIEAGAVFLVMELLRGESLRALIAREGKLSPELAVQLLLPAIEGVAAAHRVGIVHRDLKPANLFVVDDPKGPHTKVLDFGISKVREDRIGPGTPSSGGALTQTGVTIGTPQYMSPEQVRGSRDLDARSDVWSLGVILYELLAGRVPFNASTYGGLLVAIATDDVPPLDAIAPDVPAGLARIVHRALSREPEARFQDVESLAVALEAFAPPGMRFHPPRAPSLRPPEPQPSDVALAPTATPAPDAPHELDREATASKAPTVAAIPARMREPLDRAAAAPSQPSVPLSVPDLPAGSRHGPGRATPAWLALPAGVIVLAGLGALGAHRFVPLLEAEERPASDSAAERRPPVSTSAASSPLVPQEPASAPAADSPLPVAASPGRPDAGAGAPAASPPSATPLTTGGASASHWSAEAEGTRARARQRRAPREEPAAPAAGASAAHGRTGVISREDF